jgi:tetrapyrrole methylase family protein/MazG family protein
MKQLTDIMSRLRSEGGCPWDREQTLETLKQYLVEECYELIDAIDSGDCERHKDELGDVLLQVLFQSQIRKEEGEFGFDDVAENLAAKLVRRHPHVFGDVEANTPEEVLKRWEAIKAAEKPESSKRSCIGKIPRSLPALLKAQRVQGRVARVGFDWHKAEDVVAKIREETDEVAAELAGGSEERITEEIGDLLFAVVNLSRYKGINSELALEKAVNRFVDRFQQVEARIDRSGRKISECSLSEMEEHWEAAKEQESLLR